MRITDAPSRSTLDTYTGLTPLNSNLKSATMAHTRKGIARVRSGTGDMKILRAGDSTCWGLGGSQNMVTQSTSAVLAACLGSVMGVPAAQGFIIPYDPTKTTPAVDSRWSYGSGWSVTSWGLGSMCISASGAGPSGNLVITPGIVADKYDIYYVTNSGLGSIAVTATGGSTVNQSTAASPGWAKVTVTAAAASAANTVTIVQSGSTVFIPGIEPWHSTIPRIRVGNAGVSNSETTAWTPNTNAMYPLNGFAAYGADLVILQLGKNDARLSSRTASAWAANMTTIINACTAAGADVIIESCIPSSSAAAPALELTYLAATPALCAATGAVMLDINTRFGDYTTASALGLMAPSDPLHGSALGYADVAGAELAFLRNVM